MNGDSLAQHHVIDKFDARQKCHALTVVEIRSAGTFVDVLRRGHGNDENIALRLRLLQMFNVPVMQQIKDAVAKDDRFILGAKFLPQLVEFLRSNNFVHSDSLYLLKNLNQSAVASLMVSGVHTGAFRQ